MAAPSTESIVRLQFNDPQPTFQLPTSFFVGIMPRSTNVFVRMDNYQQPIYCAGTDGDSLYTNSFWQPLDPPYIPFGSHLSGNVPLRNWYIGVKIEYINQAPTTFFTDATLLAGVNGMPESGRMSWGDFDDDGDQDLLYGSHLYSNNGNGKFTDVASQVGYTQSSEIQMFVDVDNDGDLDIVCQPLERIYFNDGGMFTADDLPGFSPGRNTQAMSFADYDMDGYPDFFVAHGEYKYMKNPANPNDSALVQGAAWEGFFYGNTQNGHYRDVKGMVLGGYRSGDYGINPYNQQQKVAGYRPVKGVEWVDIDLDGDLDLYACNDRLQPNYLFENQGNGFLREVAQLHSLQGQVKTNPDYIGLFGSTRGCNFGDFDNDGDMDLMTGEAADQFRLLGGDWSAVWTNSGKPSSTFTMVDPSVTQKRFDMWNADVAWGDFNNDGLLDVAFTPGDYCDNASLYLQNPDHSFQYVTYTAGIDAFRAQGVTWADYDNDGDLDLAIASENGLKLYRNDMPGTGNWIGYNVRSRDANSHAIGARITVFAGGKQYVRFVTAGKGAGVQQPYVQLVGIGDATAVDSTQVKYPNGVTHSYKDLAINQYHDLTEPEPVSVDDPAAPAGLLLAQNYPNPFSSEAGGTSIRYNLTSATDVRLEIFDTRGALVRTLVSSAQDAGEHVVRWNGFSDTGLRLASGVYQYRLTAGSSVLNRRLVITR
jgi:hypothetical protein